MTSAVSPATALGRPTASPGPVIAVIDPLESAGRFGPAMTTEPTQRRAGLQALQARREVLAERLARLQRQNRSRDVSLCSAELRAVTNELMKMGRA